MVNIPCLHLSFYVANPENDRGRIDIERTLEDGSRPTEFLLFELPSGIAHPVVHVNAIAPHIVFEVLSFPALILV